jgi:hypothetical protein
MKKILLLLLVTTALLGQQALAQQKNKSAGRDDDATQIARSVIAGDVKVDSGLIKNALNVGLGLIKKNQQELAWDMLVKVYDDNPKMDDEDRWLYLNTLIDAAEKINKKSKTAITFQKVKNGLTASNYKTDFSYVIVKAALKLAKKDQTQKFQLLTVYLEALIKNLKKGALNKDHEFQVLWAFDEIYILDLKLDKDISSFQYMDAEFERYKITKEYLTYLKDGGLTQDDKLYIASTITQAVINHESFNNARDLVALAEPFLFVETADQKVLGNQILALGQLIPRNDYYLSTKKLEDLTDFLEKTTKKSNSEYTKFASAMMLGNFYSDHGYFEKADNQFKIALENIDYKGDQADMGRGFRLMINSMQLKSWYVRGNLNQVVQKTPPIYSELNWFFKDYLKKYPKVISAAGGFSMIVEIQTFLGNYKEATSLGERILAALEAARRDGIDVNSAILITSEQLSTAYEKAGNVKRAEELKDIKFGAELRANRIPVATYIKWYM